MALRYVVHPGYVRSAHDKDEHYIGFTRLCSLYCVPVRDCVNAEKLGAIRGLSDDVIHLYPRRDGNYTLPAEREG